MAHLIDKSALVAEIEKRKNMFYDMSKGCEDASSAKAGFYAQAQTLEGILSFIDILEVKEVNLEEEIQRQYNVHKNPNNSIVKNCVVMTKDGFEYFAKHFFELGLKAQKGE